MYSWKWYIKDIKQEKNVTVFSTFSCGGGSTMGYKRAGFRVLGNVEIDEKVNAIYVKNQHPKYNFLMDLRDFNKRDDLPDELYSLDILDGSPPCSTFSLAGSREKAWGKEKVFREGQKAQTLDDLFFVFLETVEKLHPKIVVAENVVGLLQGNAKGYVNLIIKRFHNIGYSVQIFRLNSAFMDVPQSRERVFFIANNQNYPKIKLDFNSKPITYGEVKEGKGKPIKGTKRKEQVQHIRRGDTSLKDVSIRMTGKESDFGRHILWDDRVAPCLVSADDYIRGDEKTQISDADFRNISTFPQDYDFCDVSAKYVCGMCVPPNMMANIATEIYKQWISKDRGRG